MKKKAQTFRFSDETIAHLDSLASRWKLSKTDTIAQALAITANGPASPTPRSESTLYPLKRLSQPSPSSNTPVPPESTKRIAPKPAATRPDQIPPLPLSAERSSRKPLWGGPLRQKSR